MPNSKAPCGHFTGKHHYRMHSYVSGTAAVLKCQWTLCQKYLVVPHDTLVALVAR
ncbi:hypothetical protein SEA_NEFERTHENA_37 [Microbacterium phage Neferthena]|uniref:Uncharacterized protein n=1 Tax=Microbacterium phage Neferthena TaxID=2301539 RepID=A0A385D4T2_9CAUD|nr:hypothetical protein HOT92_gp37 [Microbacterium phage Neferthena]AXQ52901.1 hypothetical protein SEA_NEFERTHENA_37 [Microbacterium phage Neferthena]